jgi:hypothetical protein
MRPTADGSWRDSDTGRVQICELRDNSQAGAGWEVQILDAGEILVSRQCASEREARFVADAARKDQLRTGSVAVEEDTKTGGLVLRRQKRPVDLTTFGTPRHTIKRSSISFALGRERKARRECMSEAVKRAQSAAGC